MVTCAFIKFIEARSCDGDSSTQERLADTLKYTAGGIRAPTCHIAPFNTSHDA